MMTSRFARRLLSQSVRPAARVSARPATAPAARRFATTDAGHAAKQSSDTPWMIGSALVFGPIIAYLLIGSTKNSAKAHGHAHKGHSSVPEPSTEKSAADVQQAEAQDVVVDPPKDAPAVEEVEAGPAVSEDGRVHGVPAIADDEGNVASAEEVKASMDQAFKANIPEDAQRAEASEAAANESAEVKSASEAEKVQSEGGEDVPADQDKATQSSEASQEASKN